MKDVNVNFKDKTNVIENVQNLRLVNYVFVLTYLKKSNFLNFFLFLFHISFVLFIAPNQVS